MRKLTRLSLALGAAAIALGGGLYHAKAADIPVPAGPPQAQLQPPPAYYGPPPVEEGYVYPPPVAYGYPPPPVAYYAYAPPPVMVLPEAYYGRPPYGRIYGPRYARGYGRWDRGYRR